VRLLRENPKVTAAIVVAVFCCVPLVITDNYFLHIINMVGIFSLLAIGLNLVLGYCGQFSVGQAGFYAIGAYTSALLCTKMGLTFWLTLPLAGIAAALAGLLVAPVLRLKGIFLGMATLAFGEIVRMTANNWIPLTGGPNGILNIPSPAIGAFTFSTRQSYYYLILACVIINYVVATRMVNSRFGRAMRAIRDNEEAAASSGIQVARYKIVTWIVAAFFSGIAGSLFAHSARYISPEVFTFWTSVNVIFMLIVGGMGTIAGSILGASVIVSLPELFRVFERYRMLIYPLSILLILIFAPGGVYGFVMWVKSRLWRARSAEHV
jgi:branched-chain amino acid transport system permease protein